MKRKIFVSLCAVFMVLVAALAVHGQEPSGKSSPVLVHYDFDSSLDDSGPYTFTVFESAKGSVQITPTYRFSGSHAVEIRDVAGDGGFAELQGYFPVQDNGVLYWHFAFMSAEPQEPFNMALAGSAHFTQAENGIAFWLKAEQGTLFQVNKGKDNPLFPVQAFRWYQVDVTLDLTKGRYDLVIRREGETEPMVDLKKQTNAVGIPGSNLYMFSFIGDLPGKDQSDARFYVDDITLTLDRSVWQSGFVAPGRRMMFIDMWNYYQGRLMREPTCLPVFGANDLGMNPTLLASLADGAHTMDMADLLILAENPRQESIPLEAQAPLEALGWWRAGCDSLAQGDAETALQSFDVAAKKNPEALIFPMSRVLALVSLKRWAEADALWLSLNPDWWRDPRYPSLAAQIGLARGDLGTAEGWLQSSLAVADQDTQDPLVRQLYSGPINFELIEDLASTHPEQWQDMVIAALNAEQGFFVLLWQKEFLQAGTYAANMADQMGTMGLNPAMWLERKADANFYGEELWRAETGYLKSLKAGGSQRDLFLKLADTYFLLGEFTKEREYRERVYGSLR